MAPERVYVYTSTTSLLSRHEVLLEWSPSSADKFCKNFREAARQVVLGSSTCSGSPLRLLPEPILVKILGIAAFPTEAWA